MHPSRGEPVFYKHGDLRRKKRQESSKGPVRRRFQGENPNRRTRLLIRRVECGVLLPNDYR